MNNTKIEWADMTWNPITGCTPISEGCANCYAKRMANRLRGRCGYPSDEPFRPGTIHQDKLYDPLKIKQPKRIFACSMGDLYHEKNSGSDIRLIYEVMAAAFQHTFIVLTKRPERIMSVLYGEEGGFYFGGGDYLPNVWHLVTVENQENAHRIAELVKLRTEGSPGWPVLGVSIEPMLGPVSLVHSAAIESHGSEAHTTKCGDFVDADPVFIPKIDLAILGGETGIGARPIPNRNDVLEVRDQCVAAAIRFFFKGWGTATLPKTAPGYYEIAGKTWREMPECKSGACPEQGRRVAAAIKTEADHD